MAHKDTEGKPPMNLLSYRALEQMAKVREFGVEKYGSTDYSDVDPWALTEAVIRHSYKYLQSGDVYDEESKLHHLAHAATSAMMALEIELYYIEEGKLIEESNANRDKWDLEEMIQVNREYVTGSKYLELPTLSEIYKYNDAQE